MFAETFKCPIMDECKGRKQQKTREGQTSWRCAYCEPAKERILAELEKNKEH